MEQVKRNKSRTAITINPDLWQKAKLRCEELGRKRDRRVSFSQLVEEALKAYFSSDPE